MGNVRLIHGEAERALPYLMTGSASALVCDPPAGIAFMGEHWDSDKGGRNQWVAEMAAIFAKCKRVVIPGGYALVWALPRTSHWTATALEDGGWIVRDVITHHFGSGFPKGRASLKPASEHWILARAPGPSRWLRIDASRVATNGEIVSERNGKPGAVFDDDSYKWPGYVFRQSPAGRWPPNLILSHAPGCKPVGERKIHGRGNGAGSGPIANDVTLGESKTLRGNYTGFADAEGMETIAEWECVEGCPIAEMGRQSGERPGASSNSNGTGKGRNCYGQFAPTEIELGYADTGTAARFFPNFPAGPRFLYVAKPARRERNAGLDGVEKRESPYSPKAVNGEGLRVRGWVSGPRANNHPTVKGINLMRWLCRLVCPPGGTILDPFMGSGSTGCAAVLESMDFIGIEREADYYQIAEARIDYHANRVEGV